MSRLDKVVIVGSISRHRADIREVANNCDGVVLYTAEPRPLQSAEDVRRECYAAICKADQLIVVGEPGLDTLFEIELALRCGCKIIYLAKSYAM